MGGKAKDDFEDDLDFADEGDDTPTLDATTANGNRTGGLTLAPRSRRNWRDVERAREEREMRRLLSPVDDWMDLDERPQRSR